MIATDLLRAAKLLIRLSMVFCIMLTAFYLGSIYGKHGNDQSIINFFSEKTEYKWQYQEAPPRELNQRIVEYNTVVRIMYLAVLLSFIIYILDFFIEPKTHFITTLVKKLKEGGNNDI